MEYNILNKHFKENNEVDWDMFSDKKKDKIKRQVNDLIKRKKKRRKTK